MRRPEKKSLKRGGVVFGACFSLPFSPGTLDCTANENLLNPSEMEVSKTIYNKLCLPGGLLSQCLWN